MSYTPKAEPANGQGTEFHAQGGVKAYANVADLVSSQFVITPELRSWLIGTRSAVSNVQLGWHETMKLVLDIESEFKITKYNEQPVGNGITEVSGRIELTHNEDGSWTGNGFLDGTTTSDSPSCNTLAFSPRGSAHYDWKVRIEDRGPQDPGSFDVWMDAGPIVEGDATGPDPFVVTVCPPGFTLTGAVVAWENLYFGMHQDMFNDYGLYTVIEPFPAAATAPPGAFGKVLASSTYEWDCSDADNPTTAKLVSCTEKTTLRLEGYQP
jgi:hypothetical protein